ncbi:FtsX-like permease family protein [Nonomuraea sp. bgisy101]|uniref:FtsX-like permease family protein n=1 Tax=Nonomuraea sp. bgisy101 TaxID=3413784 RepID=UPI003D710895
MIRTALAMAGFSGLVVAFLAVFGGMALLTGSGVIIESGVRSSVSTQRLAGADVIVSARQSIPQPEDLPVALPERAVVPASLVARLAAVPGVASAVGDLSFPATVIPGVSGTAGTPIMATGHGWSSATLTRTPTPTITGTAPRAASEIALPSATPGARLGQKVRVVAAGTTGDYRVTALVDSPGLYFSDETATRLAARDTGPRAKTVDLVALRAAPGVSAAALAADLGRLFGERYEISTGRTRGDAESPGTAAARAMLIALPASIGGISLMVVGFVVAGGLSLSIDKQRRDLALLRAAGATPRQVRRLVSVQGTAAALAALIPGAALGYFLAARFGDLLVSIGMLPGDLPLSYSPLPALAAALLLLAVVRTSAWGASYRASQMSAVSAVAESRSEPRAPSRIRTTSGLLLMLAAVGLSAIPLVIRTEFAAIGPGTAALLAVIGLALAGPSLIQRATGMLARRLPPGLSAPAWLAVSNTHGYALRTAGAVAALGMAVTLALSVVLTQTTIAKATEDEAAQGIRADATITAPALGGIPHDLLSDVRAARGVTAATAFTTTTVLARSLAVGDDARRLVPRPAMVLGPDAEGLVDLGITRGGLAALKGDTIALDERAGRLGEHRELIMGDGTRVRARVVATYTRALGFGPMVLSRDLAAGHTTTGLDSTILVRLAPGASPLPALLKRWPGTVLSPDPGLQLGRPSGELWVNAAVIAVLLGYVMVAVTNRLVATTTGRTAELTALRHLGATPRQLRSMIRWEALVVAAAAAGSGLLLAAVPLTMLSIGFLSRPWPAGPLWLAPAVVLAVTMVVWLALDLPARRIIRRI